ncbi:LOW QUALITY PROTEIN: hypothetical protein KUTeg_021841 [Tegillarca granosa]|uniref:ALOG domain-containing protein n=1 Tax=Tegillarca granosa TaxID=220873 RepID=A0ABQ9E4X5_TEGGR|nr:LOW QUALITY PROTEIN: hypothetical protein KUTeg_021841 [Tegillarca granosa]
MLELLTRLGYTLSLKKCSFVPSTCKKFLGFFIDSLRQRVYIVSTRVPGCKLFCREVNAAISFCTKNSRKIWGIGWDKKDKIVLGDYWLHNDERPIHEKEADVILKSLLSLGKSLPNSRVDVCTDNMAVICAWNSQGGKSQDSDVNIDLHLSFVSSVQNVADGASRILSAADTMLNAGSWLKVEDCFGPHTVDLMSLDSNVMCSSDNKPLRHFTPWPTPETAEVNVFSRDLTKESNPYVYPPFVLIFPLLNFLREQRISCTIDSKIGNMWWPNLINNVIGSVCLGLKGEKGLLKYLVEGALLWIEVAIVGQIDLGAIDKRLADLDERTCSSVGFKSEKSLLTALTHFLEESGCPSLTSCTPDDVRRFLVWKDSCGKTVVHDVQCPFLGLQGLFGCNCPKRLPSSTVEGWDSSFEMGNQASAPVVKEYLKLIKAEQAHAHVVPKQAKPIFLTKVEAMCCFISREVKILGLPLKEKFILYRDQAWFKLQFFAGDRAGNLSFVEAQEKCEDLEVCPIKGLLDYVEFCKAYNVDLSKGYLFRIVSENGIVLDKPVSYSVFWENSWNVI